MLMDHSDILFCEVPIQVFCLFFFFVNCLSFSYGFVGEAVSFWVIPFSTLSLLYPFRVIQSSTSSTSAIGTTMSGALGSKEKWCPKLTLCSQTSGMQNLALRATVLSRALPSSSCSLLIHTKAWQQLGWFSEGSVLTLLWKEQGEGTELSEADEASPTPSSFTDPWEPLCRAAWPPAPLLSREWKATERSSKSILRLPYFVPSRSKSHDFALENTSFPYNTYFGILLLCLNWWLLFL